MDLKFLKRKLKQLQKIVKELEDAFADEKRKFTLDGHLLGSIGEIYCKLSYTENFELYKSNTKAHDAKYQEQETQIKITQNQTITLYYPSERLIVLRLTKKGEIEEVYNGDGMQVWNLKPDTGLKKTFRLNQIKSLLQP